MRKAKIRTCCRCGIDKPPSAYAVSAKGICRSCKSSENYILMYNGYSPAGGDGGIIQDDPVYIPAFYPRNRTERREMKIIDIKSEKEIGELHCTYLDVPIDDAMRIFQNRYHVKPAAIYRRTADLTKSIYLYLALPEGVTK